MRIALICISTILMGTMSFNLYREIKIPQFTEEKIPVYSYMNKSNIGYKVFLKPNILYDQESLGEGEIYLTEFVDYIQASFSYEFTGERQADIKSEREIVAEVEGYTEIKEEIYSIWKKTFVLLPKEKFEEKEKRITIKENVSFNLEEYGNFAKQVMESSNFNSSIRLTVKMNISTEADTDKGLVKEENYPAMIIPLNASYFTVQSKLQEENSGAIKETKQVAIPLNKNLVILYGFVIGVLFIALLFLFIFTKASQGIDPLEKQLKKIFKKHGDRLVALNSEVAIISEQQHNEVYSMEDLVRIADEIGKPIIYKYSPNYKDISKFFVSDEILTYSLDIHKMLMKPRMDRKKKKVIAKQGLIEKQEENFETEDNNVIS